ncbi:CRISPR-associated exonuclease Cas4 [Candidatus Methanophagaceae archaeon]|nr:CRISPR-associated exonuclease Cas4 [Methanophagales archaeon]
MLVKGFWILVKSRGSTQTLFKNEKGITKQGDKMVHETPKVKVSDLTQYGICPRLVYFRAREPEHAELLISGNERIMIERILWKELAFNLHKIYGCEVADEVAEPEKAAKSVLDEIVDDVEHIYKKELDAVAESVLDDEKREFVCYIVEDEEWLSKARAENELLELQQMLGYDREHAMVSEKLRLNGSVDKLITTENELIPCMIKTGKSPEYGVWPNDRMQLAAYALLIEETFETTVQRGFVEYIRAAEFRESPIRRKDRARALQTLKHVRRIKSGAYPDKSVNAPCANCVFLDRCDTRITLLSKLLGKNV